MDTNGIVLKIRQELVNNSDEKTRISSQHFFKEAIRTHGVNSFMAERIGKSFFRTLPDKSKESVFKLCEILWQSG